MHTIDHDDDSWISTEMRQAELALDSAVEAAYREMARTDELLAELEVDAERRQVEEAAIWEAHAGREGAPAQWRRVIERVNEGTLRWVDLASGEDHDDPDVRAALDADRAREP